MTEVLREAIKHMSEKYNPLRYQVSMNSRKRLLI